MRGLPIKENGGWPMTDVRSSRRYLSQGTLTTRTLHTRRVRACESVTAAENATAVFNPSAYSFRLFIVRWNKSRRFANKELRTIQRSGGIFVCVAHAKCGNFAQLIGSPT
jgi:hypothetical protein